MFVITVGWVRNKIVRKTLSQAELLREAGILKKWVSSCLVGDG